jgi:hypothetical protein
MSAVVIAVSTEVGEQPFTCQFSFPTRNPGCRTVIAASVPSGLARPTANVILPVRSWLRLAWNKLTLVPLEVVTGTRVRRT